MEKGWRGREDEKETKKQLALGFQVRKELALFVHVNFFFLPWPVVCKALAGIDRHGLPNSACTGNNGAPVLRVWVLEGREDWSGSGGRREAGGQLITTNCLRAPGLKFRFGKEAGWQAGWLAGGPRRWSCQISDNDHFHWNLCWQLAAANLLTSHPCQLHKPTAKVLESPRGPQGRHNNSAAPCALLQKKKKKKSNS